VKTEAAVQFYISYRQGASLTKIKRPMLWFTVNHECEFPTLRRLLQRIKISTI